jgi:hypothetical protein
VPTAHASAAEQVDDREQDDRADQSRDQVAGPAAKTQTDHRQQETAQQTADDADDDVEQDALLAIGLHEHACQPACDAAHNQHDDEVHAPDSLRDEMGPAPLAGADATISGRA